MALDSQYRYIGFRRVVVGLRRKPRDVVSASIVLALKVWASVEQSPSLLEQVDENGAVSVRRSREPASSPGPTAERGLI